MDHTYRTVGKFQISDLCLQTYPCKHYIIFENGDKAMMSGDKIYTLLTDNQLSDDHFHCYGEYIRKRDFPTPEEIQQRAERVIKMKQYNEDRIKKQKEQEQIIQQYKASSRLDKLKQQCQISKIIS